MNQFQYFPISDPKLFEEFICDYFNDFYDTESFKIYGRNGQTQNGYDVYSAEKQIYIQCKQVSLHGELKKISRILLAKLEVDFSAFQKYILSIKPHIPVQFYAASTFLDDTSISDFTIKNTNEKFNVDYWSWTTLIKKIKSNTYEKYNHQFSLENKKIIIDVQNRLQTTSIKIENKVDLIQLLKTEFETIYKQLNFIPKGLLNTQVFCKFSINSYMGSNYVFPNHKIFEEVFSSIKLNLDSAVIESSINLTSEQIESVKFISEKLYRNGVYYFEGNDYQKHEFLYDFPKICNCIRCRYFRFEFNRIDVDNKIKDETEFDFHFKRAFYFMKLGKWQAAVNDWFSCLELYNTEIESINTFKVKYNLKKAANRMYSEFLHPDVFDEILKKIEDLPFEPYGFVGFNDELLERISKWMFNDNYIFESLKILEGYKLEIIKTYELSHRNGYSNYNHFSNLYYSFFDIYSFLEENQIYFQDFSEWQEIINSYFEGIIASYTTKNTCNSLEALESAIVKPILFYGDFRNIVKTIEKYNIERITYKKHEIDCPLLELINNIIDFKTIAFLETFFSSEEEYAKKQFEQKFEKWFNNTLILLAYIEFEENYIQSCITKIITKILSGYTRFEVNCLEILIENRASLINQILFNQIISIFWTIEKEDTKDFIASLVEVSSKNNLKTELSSKEFERFIEYYKNTSEYELFGILNLIKLLDGKQNTKAIVLLNHFISECRPERIDLYVQALFMELIDFDIVEFREYVFFVSPTGNTNLIGRPLFERVNSSGILNQLIGLLYHYKFDKEEISHLVVDSDYYEWLINLDSFDYSKFNVDWVLLYYSKFYITEFKKHPQIKDAILTYLKTNENDRLTKFVLKLI